MAVEFGTLGFFEAMAQQLNADPVWAQKSSGIDYRMVYSYGPPVSQDFAMAFRDTKVEDVRLAQTEDVDAADYVISAPSEVWRSIFDGELNPTVAMARGKVKIKGNTAALVTKMGAFKYVIEVMSGIEYV